MPYRANYPRSVGEVLDDRIRYRSALLRAVRRFRDSKPWRGADGDRMVKIGSLHFELCSIYGRRTRLAFGRMDGGSSGASSYNRITDTITLCGRLSVVTYLHEWAHALGRDERGACRWSINLFRRIFPRSFARCGQSGHMLVRNP